MSWRYKSKFLRISDHTKIHYLSNFDGKNDDSRPVIVFNYGLVCNFEHFKYQITFFEENGFTILLHDYRCHYESISSQGIPSCTFENICSDLKALLDHLNIKKCIMFSHSMGVNVTLEFAKLYPEYLRGIVLISGTVFPPQDIMFDSNIIDLAEPSLHELRRRLGTIYDSIWINVYKNPFARLIVWQGGFNMKKTKLDFVEHYMKKIGELSPDLFFHLLTEMRKHNIINFLNKIKTPTLIIGGDKDKIIPNYLQRILKKYLENSTLYVVKDGSHVPQIDFPKFINEISDSFVKKLA